MRTALAYFNHGRWVAECPVPECGDARALHPQDREGNPSPIPVYVQHCAAGHEFRIEAPPDDFRARIESALSERISEQRKNWFPKDHPYAVAAGFPHGQTVRELREETERGEAFDAQILAERRGALLRQLKEVGVTLDEALAVLKGV